MICAIPFIFCCSSNWIRLICAWVCSDSSSMGLEQSILCTSMSGSVSSSFFHQISLVFSKRHWNMNQNELRNYTTGWCCINSHPINMCIRVFVKHMQLTQTDIEFIAFSYCPYCIECFTFFWKLPAHNFLTFTIHKWMNVDWCICYVHF